MPKMTIVPIKVDKIIDVDRFRREVNNALNATAAAIKVDFHVTTRTWRRRPPFKIVPKGENVREIFTENEIYSYVNFGTRPHIIRPVRAPALRFQSGYVNKTIPNRIMSRQGGPFGPVVYAMEVHHPGFPAREFDKTIQEKWLKEWPRNLERAILAGQYV